MITGDALRAAARRRRTQDVEVPGVGTVRIVAMSAGAIHQFRHQTQKHQQAGKDPEELGFLLIAQSWVDEEGNPLLPVEEGEQVARELDSAAYNALASAVLKLNGMDPDAVDEAVKNSSASQSESTHSGSPENSDTST
jgi:hypothetical protein